MKDTGEKPTWLSTNHSKTSDNATPLPAVLEPLNDNRGKYPRPQKEKPWAAMSSAETLEQFKQEVATTTEIEDLVNVRRIDDLISMLLTFMTDPQKLERASYKEIAVVYGILCDKRANAVATHIKKQSGNSTTLRVAWRGGEGAIEVTADNGKGE